MRVSVDEMDSGYDPEATHCRYEAYLDGHLIDKAITADEELGEVQIYVQGPDGKLIIDWENHCAVRQTLHGRVEIKVLW